MNELTEEGQVGITQAAANGLPSVPHLADIGVLALVPTGWGVAWQPPHQILTRLSRFFNVVWCTPAQSWREIWYPRTSKNHSIDYGRPPARGFTIYRPPKWLPEVGRPGFIARWISKERLKRAHQILLSQGCRKTILYIWRPCYGLALDIIDHDLSCYHVDDEYTFSDIEKPLDENEAQLLSRVGQVFIHSPALMEKKGTLNPRTVFVPNGVDFSAYATPHMEPPDLRPIPLPRVGYVGWIKKQLDFALLVALAQRHRDWSFVLVGPGKHFDVCGQETKKLKNMSNVYFLGPKPVNTLPAYTQHLDVCIMCYKLNGYTKFIYPLKLHEYLASGRPVVGSPIRSLHDFADVIRLAHTTDEWSKALHDSLSPALNTAEQVEARRSVARRHDWNRLAELIARTMCWRLGTVYRERFQRLCIEQGLMTTDGLEFDFSGHVRANS
jgi:glycosyltransferase involved in cell wall biosynthesis